LTSLLLAACATLPAQEQGGQPPTEAPRSTDTQVPAPAAKTPADDSKTSLPENVVIEFRISGGIAGVNEDWLIYSDGHITQGDKEWQVSPEAVEQLLAKIETLGFFEMTGNYMELNTCCDRFTYEVTVRNGDKVNSVTTIDAAPGVPPELWQVIDAINSLVKN
jgi:hypothetical protein